MESMNSGNLSQLVDFQINHYHKTSYPIISEEQAYLIMRDILSGLSYIHEKDYIHRDMKPDNILLSLSTTDNGK